MQGLVSLPFKSFFLMLFVAECFVLVLFLCSTCACNIVGDCWLWGFWWGVLFRGLFCVEGFIVFLFLFGLFA